MDIVDKPLNSSPACVREMRWGGGQGSDRRCTYQVRINMMRHGCNDAHPGPASQGRTRDTPYLLAADASQPRVARVFHFQCRRTPPWCRQRARETNLRCPGALFLVLPRSWMLRLAVCAEGARQICLCQLWRASFFRANGHAECTRGNYGFNDTRSAIDDCRAWHVAKCNEPAHTW